MSAGGLLVGLAGVGGILVPPVLILMSGLEPHTAMGTALTSFIGTGFVGTWLYHKNGHYRFIEAVPFALGSFVCAAPGALVNARIDAGPLVMILAVIIVFAGACTLRPPKPGRKGSPFWLGWKGRAVIGGATGFMAGLTAKQMVISERVGSATTSRVVMGSSPRRTHSHRGVEALQIDTDICALTFHAAQYNMER